MFGIKVGGATDPGLLPSDEGALTPSQAEGQASSIDVSVVIPCFNRARLLREAIASCLASASRVSMEVVVVDDGSTEDLRAELAAFGTTRIVYERLVQNSGPSVARGRGIELATGLYVKFLDSDDLLVAGALDREVQTGKSTTADVVISDWGTVEFDVEGNPVDSSRVVYQSPAVTAGVDGVMEGKFLSISAGLYRRSRLSSQWWDPELLNFEEWKFFAHVLLVATRITYTHEVSFWCRHHSGERLSAGSASRRVRSFYHVLDWMEQEIARRGALTAERRRGLAQHRYRELMSLADLDRRALDAQIEHILQLDPGFAPTWPEPRAIKRALTLILGFRTGLRCWLRMRAVAHGARQRLGKGCAR